MKNRGFFGLLLCVAAGVEAGAATPEPAASAPADGCAPAGKLQFICGTKNAEDLEHIPGTDWILASGMTRDSGPGDLYLVNARDKQWQSIGARSLANPKLDAARYGDCSGPPDAAKFAPHGLNLRAGSSQVHTLYVVNHGGRESIEIFSVDARGKVPSLRWVGCAVIDSKVFLNSVAALPDGGFVVTKFYEVGGLSLAEAMKSGANTGAVYEWQPRSGFRLIPDSELPANNGIEVSADGKSLFVAAWSANKLVRMSRTAGSQRSTIELDFMPDNIRRAPDGTLLVSGPSVTPAQLMACRDPACAPGTTVLRLDPVSMKTSIVGQFPSSAYFSGATTALQVGDTLWLASVGAERIAYTPLK